MSLELGRFGPLILAVFVILTGIFAYLWWQEKNKLPEIAKKPSDVDQSTNVQRADDDTTVAAKNWFAQQAMASQYEQMLLERSKKRNGGRLIPIDVEIGNAYMDSYRLSL